MIDKIDIIVGLSNGDEGKGTIVDYLTSKHKKSLVVRYGGPQAAHNVVNNGRHHTFSQFGSGTLNGALTYLSPLMLVEPFAIEKETEHLKSLGITNPLDNLYVDANCVIVTPIHKYVNRLREMSRENKHGSCGIGIGETRSDCLNDLYLTIDDVIKNIHREKLEEIYKIKINEFLDPVKYKDLFDTSNFKKLFSPDLIDNVVVGLSEIVSKLNVVNGSILDDKLKDHKIVIEGSQGILLDEYWGFHPHTTWLSLTTNVAETLINEECEFNRIGVIRSYSTRHGNGPLPTEDNLYLMEQFNDTNDWQGNFRFGWLDLTLTKYAILANSGVDSLAVTHVDKLEHIGNKVCDGYVNGIHSERLFELANESIGANGFNNTTEYLNGVVPSYIKFANPQGVLDFIADSLDVKIGITSFGPNTNDKESH